jgi:hypothetical protein
MRAIATLLLGLVLGLALGLGLGARRDVAGGDPGELGSDRQWPVERLEQVVAQLERHVASRAEASGAPGKTLVAPGPVVLEHRVPASERPDEVLTRLAALQEAVDALRESIRTPEERLEAMRAARPEADWEALDPLVALYRVDSRAARGEVLLASAAQVVERYGTPDLIWGDVNWVYGRGWIPVREAWALQVVFQVRDGFVQGFWVEE